MSYDAVRPCLCVTNCVWMVCCHWYSTQRGTASQDGDHYMLPSLSPGLPNFSRGTLCHVNFNHNLKVLSNHAARGEHGQTYCICWCLACLPIDKDAEKVLSFFKLFFRLYLLFHISVFLSFYICILISLHLCSCHSTSVFLSLYICVLVTLHLYSYHSTSVFLPLCLS